MSTAAIESAAQVEHEKDLLIACPKKGCRAAVGVECKDTEPGIVHFGRRLTRLLKGFR
jgi:hypothetical protein